MGDATSPVGGDDYQIALLAHLDIRILFWERDGYVIMMKIPILSCGNER